MYCIVCKAYVKEQTETALEKKRSRKVGGGGGNRIRVEKRVQRRERETRDESQKRNFFVSWFSSEIDLGSKEKNSRNSKFPPLKISAPTSEVDSKPGSQKNKASRKTLWCFFAKRMTSSPQ